MWKAKTRASLWRESTRDFLIITLFLLPYNARAALMATKLWHVLIRKRWQILKDEKDEIR